MCPSYRRWAQTNCLSGLRVWSPRTAISSGPSPPDLSGLVRPARSIKLLLAKLWGSPSNGIAKARNKATKQIGQIKDGHGVVIREREKIKDRWKSYFGMLLNEENPRTV